MSDAAHMTWAGGWYCNIHDAGFESQEMERNDGDCPWCGRSVEAGK
jgi:hypothetical protein